MDPFRVIKSRYVTEKSIVLENLHNAKSNRSLARCENPKYVFIVDTQANKHQIAAAIETIYAKLKVKVVAVNTVNVRAKPKRQGRGRPGQRASFKKAVVTLEAGDNLDAG